MSLWMLSVSTAVAVPYSLESDQSSVGICRRRIVCSPDLSTRGGVATAAWTLDLVLAVGPYSNESRCLLGRRPFDCFCRQQHYSERGNWIKALMCSIEFPGKLR
ncbi:hypothetical protein DFS33DRAFT_1348875, partial [Desarmillaria ectypa]